ncbi:hypothetical protein LZ198_13920 [Myxococcus sp. K15C18031901]|uniref:hypothetical protein n=1 Tax=Myxococcus dinghuensis TaxID=2906761 RepID=UPI0020A81891|nr:hypothetical protein [Myxococcus dinghuensis]MCP3099968.1 hypothetical protein [Myxococcus dinghuensis]
MPLAECAGGCPRLVSLSVDPGGNPMAAADPARFRVRYHHCPACQRFWCDGCEQGGSPCRSCGGALEGPTPRHALELIFGGRGRVPERLLATLVLRGTVFEARRRGGN